MPSLSARLQLTACAVSLLCCATLCQAAAPAAEPVPLVQTGDRIAIFGDSISTGKGYGFIAVDLMNKALPELKLTAFDHGHPGWRSDHALAVVDKVLADKPTLVTIMFGTNDIGQRGARGITDLPEHLGKLVARFKAAGVRIVLLTPPYNSSANPNGAALNAAGIPRMGEAVFALGKAEQLPVFDMFTAMKAAESAGKAKDPTLEMFGQPGDCHPNRTGHELMGAALADFLLGRAAPQHATFVWKNPGTPRAVATHAAAIPDLAKPFPGEVTMRINTREQALEPGRWKNPEELSAGAKAVWNDTGLCVEVAVTDTTAFAGAKQPAWGDDGIEFFVDVRSADKRDVAYSPGYFQFLVPRTAADGPTPLYPGGMDELKLENAKAWCGHTEKGYVIRFFLPWAALHFNPAGATDIGLDIALNNKTDEKTGRYKMLWRGAGDDYLNAGATGVLELKP